MRKKNIALFNLYHTMIFTIHSTLYGNFLCSNNQTKEICTWYCVNSENHSVI